MLLRLSSQLSQRRAGALERPRIPWVLVLGAVVVVANVTAVVLTLIGQ